MKRFTKRSKLKLVAFALAVYVVLDFTRLIDYVHQKNYFTNFSYPLDVNLTRLIGQLRARRRPDVTPPNPFRYDLLLDCPSRCPSDRPVEVLFVVKSSSRNVANRMAIRQTWGSERRFQDAGAAVVRRVFLLAAVPPGAGSLPGEQASVQDEQARFGDIVQGSFLDNYYNNTWKTIMGLKWAAERCPHARFVMFVDDDFYVSPKNLLRLIRNPDAYPAAGVPPHSAPAAVAGEAGGEEKKGKEEDEELAEQRHWYTGHLFFVLPVRFAFHKFFVSLDEYPYNVFPPFINAGAFVVSRRSLVDFHYASLYTLPLKLDDVYVGILAKKVGVRPTHNRYFYPYKVPSSDKTYADLIASHGYRDPQALLSVWKQQVECGNA